jgi:hypothetical protein
LTATEARELLLRAYGITVWNERRPEVDVESHAFIKEINASALFGEIQPVGGVDLACDENHLHANAAKFFLELGAGQGKIALQVSLSPIPHFTTFKQTQHHLT